MLRGGGGAGGTLVTEIDAGIGTTSTDGITLTNTTAAAAGAQQWSPRLRFTGQGWKTNATAASDTCDWIVENQTVQGSSGPITSLVFSAQTNAAGYNAMLQMGNAIDAQVAWEPVATFNPANNNGVTISSGTSGTGKIQFGGGSPGGNGYLGINTTINGSNGGAVVNNLASFSFSSTINALDAPDTHLTRGGVATLQFGAADAASPVAQIVQAQSVVAGNANTAGATLTIAGSKSNGSGGGDILIKTTLSNASSGTQNALATALTLKGGTQSAQAATTFASPTVGNFSATTGAATMNVATSNFFTLTPSGNMTAITTTGTQVAGTYYYVVITTSGVSSFTLTFSTGFKVTGTLATGTSSGKVFVMQFISDGTNLNEVSRTTAM